MATQKELLLQQVMEMKFVAGDIGNMLSRARMTPAQIQRVMQSLKKFSAVENVNVGIINECAIAAPRLVASTVNSVVDRDDIEAQDDNDTEDEVARDDTDRARLAFLATAIRRDIAFTE